MAKRGQGAVHRKQGRRVEDGAWGVARQAYVKEGGGGGVAGSALLPVFVDSFFGV